MKCFILFIVFFRVDHFEMVRLCSRVVVGICVDIYIYILCMFGDEIVVKVVLDKCWYSIIWYYDGQVYDRYFLVLFLCDFFLFFVVLYGDCFRRSELVV